MTVPSTAFADEHMRAAAQAVLNHDARAAINAARQSQFGLDTIGSEGDTLLSLAVQNDDRATVEALLAAGANPNIPEELAPIAVAAENARMPILQLLLKAGADPNGRVGSETALWRLALAGRLDAAKLLLDAGANPDRANAGGDTPTIAAVQADHYRMALLLLDHGASAVAKSKIGFDVAFWTTRSRIPGTSVEGQAREQLIARLEQLGISLPASKAR